MFVTVNIPFPIGFRFHKSGSSDLVIHSWL